jgi:hypothetical protein
MKYKERDELVVSLRELADFIEEKGLELPSMSITASGWISSWSNNYRDRNHDIEKELTRRAAIALGDSKKEYSSSTFQLRKQFGAVNLVVNTSRESICKKVVTGKKEVPKYEQVGTEEIDDVTWVCSDSILRA